MNSLVNLTGAPVFEGRDGVCEETIFVRVRRYESKSVREIECAPAVGQDGRMELTPLLRFRRMDAVTRHRPSIAAFKRQVAEEVIAGDTLHHDPPWWGLSLTTGPNPTDPQGRTPIQDPVSAPIGNETLKICSECVFVGVF
jgi:hypothetical protein